MARLSRMPAVLNSAPLRVNFAPKKADDFYLSKEWRRLVDQVKAVRGKRCEACGCKHCRLIGDHIREIKDGGAMMDITNVQLLCLHCHNRKTAKAKKQRL